MSNLKRVAIFLAVAAALVVVSVSFRGNEVSHRSIVLGVGVDCCENGVEVTAEIVAPSGEEKNSAFSKTVSAQGVSVAEALQNIAVKTGKETSLGQCVLLVVGEELAVQGFADVTDYFIRSDSFRESATVCTCFGSAKNLLNSTDAVAESTSVTIADKLKETAKDVAVPTCDLLTFARSQQENYKTGFLNYVQYVPSQNEEGSEGFFRCSRAAVFRSNKLVYLLDERETQGFALLCNKVKGNVFAVQSDTLLTLRANGKKVQTKLDADGVEMSVKLHFKLARTDSFGSGGVLAAKTEKQIPKEVLWEAQRQAEELARLFLQKQCELDFDLLNFHELFRQRGDLLSAQTLPTEQIKVNLAFDVQEK